KDVSCTKGEGNNKRAKTNKACFDFFTVTTRKERRLRRREVYLPKGVLFTAPKTLAAPKVKVTINEQKQTKLALIFYSDDAKGASFATTGGLSPQRSAVYSSKDVSCTEGEGNNKIRQNLHHEEITPIFAIKTR
ncbi:MAG: hypothetical protein IJB01_03090, partial [Bacteroidaceae bacterium]|nr:hypothetical protein [Bacteroidaceae bacterium]